MNNLPEILQDEELYAELEKAYLLAKPYRNKVQYRKSILNYYYFSPDGRFAHAADYNVRQILHWALIDAMTGYVHKKDFEC